MSVPSCPEQEHLPALHEKTSEMTAIPELLDLVDVEGVIAAIDALVLLEAIVKNIASKGAGYAIALKENQRALCKDARLYFEGFGRNGACSSF